jgi:hypothetical protein
MLSPQQIAHREYLKSATWQDIRKQVLERDNYTCKCGQKGYDVHHKTYKNWGNENLNDLITLCRSCHEQQHAIRRGIGKHKKKIRNVVIWRYLNPKQKQTIMDKFNLNDYELEKAIYLNPNKLVLNFARKLLGYPALKIEPPQIKPIDIKPKKTKKGKGKVEFFNLKKLSCEETMICEVIIK